jgi:hypothetical protein
MKMIEQIIRLDVLYNLLQNTNIDSNIIFNSIISDDNESRKGFLYETLSIILIITKCINISYTNILIGQIQSLQVCNNIKDLLNHPINQGNNPADICIKNNDIIISFSIKYNNKFKPKESGILELNSNLEKNNKKYKLGLIVKNKNKVSEHQYKNEQNILKQLHLEIINNNLLFDENDIINGIKIFCNKFKNYNLNDFIEIFNKEYLLSPRKYLTLMLHQKMTFIKFIQNKNDKMHLISHKPRSGKSITILYIIKYLLENNYDKILIITPIPDTINSFIEQLDKYNEFINIKYINQDKIKTVNKDFKGIIFCSLQYLKSNIETKILLLKTISFDVLIIDESHIGMNTIKTQDIFNIDEIKKNIKVIIFLSGTPNKTKKYYNIKHIYDWNISDEGFMKENLKDSMIQKHGNIFLDCYNDISINKDYSKYPTQVLIKYEFPKNIINQINKYNAKHNTNYGFSWKNLLALNKNNNGFEDRFEISKTNDGIQLLQDMFNCIISNDKMHDTIMKKIEKTQYLYNSRITSKKEPKLFIIYLPINTRNNNINQLQKTIKKFIKEHDIWENYNIEYSNSIDDSGGYKQEYNTFIKNILNNAKDNNKLGCILLLGSKGTTGITYHECDVTISLDDGHDIDNLKQKYSRALTEADNKTIGINVDMNVQRTFLYINDLIHNHRKYNNNNKSNGEILQYLYEHKIFLFDPLEIHNKNIKSFEITDYYNIIAKNFINYIDDTNLLNEIIITDDDILLDNEIAIKCNWNKDTNDIETVIINPILEGENKDLPTGECNKFYDEQINSSSNDNNIEQSNETEENKSKLEQEKEKLKNICKKILFPLVGLLTRNYEDLNYKNIMTNNYSEKLIKNILDEKNIKLNINYYNKISKIMDNNEEIINNIKEIYRNAPPDKIHQLIAKHFIPSIEEKKQNAEIPTPIQLCNDMLSQMPLNYWKYKNKTFEPCCGKGNFVIRILL